MRRTRTALRSESYFSFIVVICNYHNGPDNGGAMPSERCHLYTFVDPNFAPTETHRFRCACGGGAGYRPRVRSAYYVSVYRHSRQADTLYIGFWWLRIKESQ